MRKIAVVVPTDRPERMVPFVKAWSHIFQRHHVHLIWVLDGETPQAYLDHHHRGKIESCSKIWAPPTLNLDTCIFNRTDAVRNLGFACAIYCTDIIQDPDAVILTLDDDVEPPFQRDPISDHLEVLKKRVPISWLSTTIDHPYMRGFPYAIRTEAEVVMSHGVWYHVPDMDAPTQLQHPELVGGYNGPFYLGPIPRGCFAPICGMNLAFKAKVLPYVYFAPMGPKALGLGRWADIFMGITAKRIFDQENMAIYTGSAPVKHTRASNVWANLRAEAEVLEMNEDFWRHPLWDCDDTAKYGPYAKIYRNAFGHWRDTLRQVLGQPEDSFDNSTQEVVGAGLPDKKA